MKGSLLVRPPAPTPEKALPYANEAADFTEGNSVSHTVKGKEKAKILLEDGQIPKGMHFQLRADILNNRKVNAFLSLCYCKDHWTYINVWCQWFQAQTIVLNEFSTYTFTLPYDDPESNTQVWIAASVVIPLAASERRILKLKDRMCFCILTQTKTMELRSDFVAKVDWNFHEDSAPYAECIMKNINRTPLEWLSMMVATAWVAILCLVCILILLCWWKSGLHHVKDSKWERDSQGRLRSKV